MNHFWTNESELPDNVGFELFSAVHIRMILVILVAVIGMAVLYRKQEKIRKPMLLTIAFLIPGLEAFKIGFLWTSGHMSIGYLPMHLCSLSIYLYPLYVVLKQGKAREIIGEFCCQMLLPAGISAILFPNWIMYPLLSYMSLNSFIWHALQILLPICLLTTGEAFPRIRTIWRSLVLLLIFSIPVWLFDRLTGCNYWFLMRPISGTPLQVIYQWFGQRGYLIGLFLLAAGMMFATQGIIAATRNIRISG